MKVKEIAIGIKHFGINCRILTQSTSEGERGGGDRGRGGGGRKRPGGRVRQRPEGRGKKGKG